MARAPQCGDDEVHVWRVPLSLPAAPSDWAESLLDDEERARASRYRCGEARARFVAGRVRQRELLARYLGVAPGEVRYRVDALGKPEVAGARDLRFNFSNSGELGLLAITNGRAVGIDIEKIRSVPDALEIASDWFSASERAVLEAVPATQRDAAFLRCWTRKEACIKAGGEGHAGWRIEELEPAVGYVGSVAAHGPRWSVRQFELREG